MIDKVSVSRATVYVQNSRQKFLEVRQLIQLFMKSVNCIHIKYIKYNIKNTNIKRF